MERLALVDVDDNPPLGAVTLQIISDNLEEIINNNFPKTYDGKILTPEQIRRREMKLLKRRSEKRTKIRKDQQKKFKM